MYPSFLHFFIVESTLCKSTVVGVHDDSLDFEIALTPPYVVLISSTYFTLRLKNLVWI